MSKKLSFEIVSIALTTLTVFGMTNPALAQVTTSGGTSADVEGNSAPGLLTDRFTGGLGTYVVSNKVKATLNGTATGSNQQVDFGHTFGEDGSVNRFRFDLLWRITPKHHVRLVYFQNNVTRNRTLDKDFAWGDRTFQANGTITAGTKLGVYEASYEYAFVRQPNFELAAGAGIHYLNMSFKLAGNATVTDANGNVSSASYTSTSSNLPAPLPVIGVRALWAVTPSIFIEPELQIFKFKYDAYDGNWTDLRIAAKWMFSRHFGVGLGYDNFHVNVDVTKSNFNGNVNLGYSGLQAMLVGSY